MNSVYDELVAGQAELYGKESAVQFERQALDKRLQQSEWMFQRKMAQTEKKRTSLFTGLAQALTFFSAGYDEWKSERDLEKSGEEMIKEGSIDKELWDKLNKEQKYMFQYNYNVNKTKSVFDEYYQNRSQKPIFNQLDLTTPEYKGMY